MKIQYCEDAPGLVAALTTFWGAPAGDPFVFDLAVVPSAGFRRWLSQQLATQEAEGVCAGVDFWTLPRLEATLLGESNPWRVEPLIWQLLTLANAGLPPELGVLTNHFGNLSQRFSACQRIARQFHGYLRHRPSLLQQWEGGKDEGPDGHLLVQDAWQPALWRLLTTGVRQATAPGASRLGMDQSSLVTIPPRVAVIAPPSLDQASLNLLQELSQHRDVRVLLLRNGAEWVPSGNERHHRLNRQLGRETSRVSKLLAAAPDAPEAPDGPPGRPTAPKTVLGALQAGLKADQMVPIGELSDHDDSLQLHLSHDLNRQVQVLREVLGRLLSENPDLEPRDIAVLTPQLDAAAPLLQAAFDEHGAGSHPSTRFRVQVSGRHLAALNPAVAVLRWLLALPSSRLEAPEVLEFLRTPGVQARFGLRTDDLDKVANLLQTAAVRWGLNPAHLAEFGLAAHPQNTWFKGLQRMLAGVAFPAESTASIGTVLALADVGSGDVALIGALSEFTSRLNRIRKDFTEPASPATWLERCTQALEWMYQGDQEWQVASLLDQLAEATGPAAVSLTNREFDALVEQTFSHPAPRAAFGNGSLIVASPEALRHVPHRVLVLLGWDAEVFPQQRRYQGDDLLSRIADPDLPDPVSGSRQWLLDALHAAQEKLVLIVQGRDVTTNQETGLATPIAELLEAVAQLGGESKLRDQITVHHPLQPYDRAYFDPTRTDLFSFDPTAFQAAKATLTAPADSAAAPNWADLAPFSTPDEMELRELTAFFKHPLNEFLKARVGVQPDWSTELHSEIPLAPGPLEMWAFGDRILKAELAGITQETAELTELLRGELPPGVLGRQVLDEVAGKVGDVLSRVPADAQGLQVRDVTVDLTLPNERSVSLSGRLQLRGGRLMNIGYSRVGAKTMLSTWLELLLLTIETDQPQQAWVIGPGGSRPLDGPSPGQARENLTNLVALRELGLSRPLPLPLRTAKMWWQLRTEGRNPLRNGPDYRLKQELKYDQDDVWDHFFPGQTVFDPARPPDQIPGSDSRERTFLGALASSVWAPILGEVR